ncbi:MAG: hypothetical protein EPO21_17755 [Chloroflexota bacterium]|nr:MAG: hypothetical protein EPO21_17755 [Chloroflexota bacterium]
MDIISGVTIVSASFLFAASLVALFLGRSGSSRVGHGRAMGVLGTMVVVYFVAITHLLLIAQQVSLALGNFVVGVVLVVVLYLEPGVSQAGDSGDSDHENWRR